MTMAKTGTIVAGVGTIHAAGGAVALLQAFSMRLQYWWPVPVLVGQHAAAVGAGFGMMWKQLSV
jgi:hypothetical protein